MCIRILLVIHYFPIMYQIFSVIESTVEVRFLVFHKRITNLSDYSSFPKTKEQTKSNHVHLIQSNVDKKILVLFIAKKRFSQQTNFIMPSQSQQPIIRYPIFTIKCPCYLPADSSSSICILA